jgi:hypothetical protein
MIGPVGVRPEKGHSINWSKKTARRQIFYCTGMGVKMEIGYIILAHQRPKQVKRLLEKLDSEGCRFYIHIDKNVDIRPFKTELAALDQANFLPDEKLEKIIWGDFGIVKATINALR